MLRLAKKNWPTIKGRTQDCVLSVITCLYELSIITYWLGHLLILGISLIQQQQIMQLFTCYSVTYSRLWAAATNKVSHHTGSSRTTRTKLRCQKVAAKGYTAFTCSQTNKQGEYTGDERSRVNSPNRRYNTVGKRACISIHFVTFSNFTGKLWLIQS